MKKSIILIISVTLGILALLLLGSIFEIGDKLGHIGAPVEYGFYALILVLLVAFVVVPVVRVHCAPQMPVLSTDGVLDATKLTQLGNMLERNCSYIPDDEARKAHRAAFRQSLKDADGDVALLAGTIDGEIAYRLEGDADRSAEGAVLGINRKIKEWARTVFLVTAISQNSKFDSLAVIAINYKMIEDIVLSTGFRPSRPQMIKLYVRVLVTSLVSYLASDAIGDFSSDLARTMPDLSDSAAELAESGLSGNRLLDGLKRARIPGIIFGSALDGAINALLTLRIGYVTRAYVLKGAEALSDKESRRAVRLSAMRDAHKSIPSVIMNSAGVIGKSAATRLVKLFSRNAEEEAAFAD